MSSTVSGVETTGVTPTRRPASPTTRFIKFILSWPGVIVVNAIIFTIYLLARLPGGNSPDIFSYTLGNNTFRFRWYGLFITCGVILAALIAQYLAERKGENPDHVWRLLPVLLVAGVLGARLWYVTNTWDDYKADPISIIYIWNGGIAIQGAVVGGIIGILIYSLFTHIKFFRWADMIAPGLVLAQSIGRWGNFMNNEAYGRKAGIPWGVQIPCQYRTSGATPGTDNTTCVRLGGTVSDTQLFHPTFFYESVWDYSIFITLFWVATHPKKTEKVIRRIPFLRSFLLRDGDVFLGYLILYSVGRFFIEGLRTDSLYFLGNKDLFRTAQALAVIGVVVGIALLLLRHYRDGRTVAVAADAPIVERTSVPTQLAKRQARRAGSLTARTIQGDLGTEVVPEAAEITETEAEAAIRRRGALTGAAVPGSKGGAPAPRVRVRATTTTPTVTAAGDGAADEAETAETPATTVITAESMADSPAPGETQL